MVKGLVQMLVAGAGGATVKASLGGFQAGGWCFLLPSVMVLGQAGQS